MTTEQRFDSFASFYPFYLGEHRNSISRRLHFIGTSIAVLLLLRAVFTGEWLLLPIALGQGYAFAWVGHFFFEHNKPATFKFPLYSFMGDWRMWSDMLRGKVPF